MKNELPCPRCATDQTTQFTMDNQKWMECHACGFQVRMKFYKREFKNNEEYTISYTPKKMIEVSITKNKKKRILSKDEYKIDGKTLIIK